MQGMEKWLKRFGAVGLSGFWLLLVGGCDSVTNRSYSSRDSFLKPAGYSSPTNVHTNSPAATAPKP
jgi:hypothetical protein